MTFYSSSWWILDMKNQEDSWIMDKPNWNDVKNNLIFMKLYYDKLNDLQVKLPIHQKVQMFRNLVDGLSWSLSYFDDKKVSLIQNK